MEAHLGGQTASGRATSRINALARLADFKLAKRASWQTQPERVER